jgi:non-ribosomal peptide synthetase component F
VIVAGEQLIITDGIKKYLGCNNVVLHNHYGPSETHVVTTYKNRAWSVHARFAAYREACFQPRIYIMNNQKGLQPVGIPGEIYIAGDCVGRGYLHNEELTKERFLPDLYSDGKMYRTGDLGRWLPDGKY